jgi:hypothetical protein
MEEGRLRRKEGRSGRRKEGVEGRKGGEKRKGRTVVICILILSIFNLTPRPSLKKRQNEK